MGMSTSEISRRTLATTGTYISRPRSRLSCSCASAIAQDVPPARGLPLRLVGGNCYLHLHCSHVSEFSFSSRLATMVHLLSCTHSTYGLSLDQTYRYFSCYTKDALNLKLVVRIHFSLTLNVSHIITVF